MDINGMHCPQCGIPTNLPCKVCTLYLDSTQLEEHLLEFDVDSMVHYAQRNRIFDDGHWSERVVSAPPRKPSPFRARGDLISELRRRGF